MSDERTAATRCSDAEPASPTAPSVATPQTYMDWLLGDIRQRVAVADHPHRLICLRAGILGTLLEATDALAEIYHVTPTEELQDERVNSAFHKAFTVLAKLLPPQPERVSPGSAPNTDAPRQIDPRDPDPTREGIFRDHNCFKCKDGALPCANRYPVKCPYLHARND